MASKFQRNGILAGNVDSFCLVCEDHLRSEEDTNNHLLKPVHKKNLDATLYLEKYKDDHIRKVKKGYFCEFCNILLNTTAKVKLHLVDVKHHNNRGRQQLKRLGDTVVALDEIIISQRAWHGLIDDTCVICNTEFDDELIHSTEKNHVLNVIQKKVQFGSGKTIFRKTDDTTFHCLTCNKIFDLNTLTTHFDHENHKKLLENCAKLYQECYKNNNKPKSDGISEQNNNLNETHEVTRDVQNKKIEIIEITDDDINEKQLVPHVKPVPTEEVKNPKCSLDKAEECSAFAKDNHLTYGKESSNVFCRLCQTRIPSSLKAMKEHASGSKHKAEVSKKRSNRTFVPKKPMSIFIEVVSTIETLFFGNDVVLNDKFCLDQLSFFMITKHNNMNRLRCQVCEVNLSKNDLNDHVETTTHELAMNDTLVVCNLDSEFVREVRPGLFHCGFCNLVIGLWEEVGIHLKCEQHLGRKKFAGIRLNDHLQNIQEHRRRQLFLSMVGVPM